MKAVRIISFLLIIACCLCLVACDNEYIKKAKNDIATMFDYVEQGRFVLAQDLVHPNSDVKIRSFFTSLEQTENVDFQSGIEIERYKSYSYSQWNSEAKGTEFKAKMSVKVSGKRINFIISVAENDGGYGIWHLSTY